MSGRVLVIGASFNGIQALSDLVRALPAGLPAPVLVVQHTSPGGRSQLPQLLARAGPLPAEHAKDGESMQPGRIYVAPPDRHLIVRPDGRLQLSHGPRENRTRPAIDATFRSAALAFGPAVVGVVLTGYLDDGTAGLLAIKDHGGIAIAQDPDEAPAPSMPLSAVRHVALDHCVRIADMAALLVALVDDAPGLEAAPADGQALAAEAWIAQGQLGPSCWAPLQRACSPAGLNCPDCRSALYELPDRRLLRFRCRAGHAFTARNLLCEQAKAREDVLALTFGALMEEAGLADRLQRIEAGRDAGMVAALNERRTRLEDHAAVLSGWLETPDTDALGPE